ncbi:hypothetical protein [Pleurocapsa sp. PCC 7319]|uniref:hypothetical protein n=1 Tax=Pleurocapsa sp. PCC 7319 TaxID=118161 RepID=UPI0011818CE0|nr:hypothetical protein [Pleurocapsa sp. PCC 7319]
MKYVIRPILPKVGNPVRINEAEYQEITNARKLAWDILLVKEFFSYVVRNFSQLESESKRIETKAKNNSNDFREQWENGSFRLENTHIFNLLVMNLLTTCRSYLDLFDYQGKNKQRELFSGEDDIRKILENIKNEHHDQNTMCNFFWKLRNYTQHHSSPITGSPTSINNPVIKIGFTTDVNKILKLSDERQELKTYLENKLSNYSQQELQKYPKKLNIRLLIKEYIIVMKNIHDEFNQKLDSKFQIVKNILDHKVEYYCQDNSPESAFEIYKSNKESQEWEERFDVSLQLFNDWEKTIEKYSQINPIND